MVAGPNGAGKSMYSRILTGLDDVFDGDLCLAGLVKDYPLINDQILKKRVDEELFPVIKQNIIEERRDFAFETNFSTADPTATVREFQAEGYETYLIFMGVPEIAESVQRVNMRKRVGGHFIVPDVVKFNFERAYINLHLYYSIFDEVSLWNNPIAKRCIPVNVLNWRRETKELELLANKLPSWAQAFSNLVKEFGTD